MASLTPIPHMSVPDIWRRILVEYVRETTTTTRMRQVCKGFKSFIDSSPSFYYQGELNARSIYLDLQVRNAEMKKLKLAIEAKEEEIAYCMLKHNEFSAEIEANKSVWKKMVYIIVKYFLIKAIFKLVQRLFPAISQIFINSKENQLAEKQKFINVLINQLDSEIETLEYSLEQLKNLRHPYKMQFRKQIFLKQLLGSERNYFQIQEHSPLFFSHDEDNIEAELFLTYKEKIMALKAGLLRGITQKGQKYLTIRGKFNDAPNEKKVQLIFIFGNLGLRTYGDQIIPNWLWGRKHPFLDIIHPLETLYKTGEFAIDESGRKFTLC